MSGQHQPNDGHPDGRHPDVTALAEYQAGLADGRRGKRLAAHIANCAHCTTVSDQIGAVTSALASAPAPPLPDAVENRITGALAAEAALRAEATTTGDQRHTAQRTREKTGPRRSRGDASGPPRGPRRLRPAVLMSGAAAAVLVLVGAVFGLIHLSSGSSSPSAASSSQAAPVSGPNVAAPAAGARAAGSAEKGPFTITTSGTPYEPATLATQVRTLLAARSAGLTLPSRASAQLPSGTSFAALSACVLHLTHQVRPSLVDWATYQGKPAYVIAVPDRAWVVGPGCHLIASIGL
jgi:hypothetical protein